MRISKVISFLTSIIVALFGFFPGSELISELYSVTYDWTCVLDSIDEAVKSSDSQALASMASPAMKKKFPDMKERLDAMFADIEGDVISYEESVDYQNTSVDYTCLLITRERKYHIEVFYTAVDYASKQTELGIRRVMLEKQTDEYYSWVVDPEHYIAADPDDEEFTATRAWVCGIGNTADEYVFLIEEDSYAVGGTTNVKLNVTRNNGDGIPASGYALHEGDELKIHFIPEGEEPPAPGTRKPDAIVKESDHPNDWVYNIKPGRYYLYVEPSDSEMYYTIVVKTRL